MPADARCALPPFFICGGCTFGARVESEKREVNQPAQSVATGCFRALFACAVATLTRRRRRLRFANKDRTKSAFLSVCACSAAKNHPKHCERLGFCVDGGSGMGFAPQQITRGKLLHDTRQGDSHTYCLRYTTQDRVTYTACAREMCDEQHHVVCKTPPHFIVGCHRPQTHLLGQTAAHNQQNCNIVSSSATNNCARHTASCTHNRILSGC